MRNTALLSSLGILMVACQEPQATRPPVAANAKTLASRQPATKPLGLDTLTSYQGTDSLYTTAKGAFYVGTANAANFALVQVADTATYLCQKPGVSWIVSEQVPYPLFSVETADVNGDGFRDIIMTYNVTMIGVNAENVVFLYSPRRQQFTHAKAYDLPNISYDQRAKLVRTAWWLGVNDPQQKAAYKPVGDSLIFLARMMYVPNALNGRTAELSFYYQRHGRQVLYRKMTGETARLERIFSESEWNSRSNAQ